MTSEHTQAELKQPIKEKTTDTLPSGVTFFLPIHQRRALLRVLKQHADNRSQAILIALGIEDSK